MKENDLSKAKRTVLIAEKGPDLGKHMRSVINCYNTNAKLCENSIPVIEETLAEKKFDALLIYIFPDDDGRRELIRRIRRTYPEIKIVAAVYTGDRSKALTFTDAGADVAVSMPMRFELIRNVIHFLLSGKDVEPHVALFLIEIGFKKFTRGFEYIATALELCLRQPGYFRVLVKGLYPAVAKRCDSTWGNVEKLLRQTFETLEGNEYIRTRVRKDHTGGLKNHEYLRILCDLYLTMNHRRRVIASETIS